MAKATKPVAQYFDSFTVDGQVVFRFYQAAAGIQRFFSMRDIIAEINANPLDEDVFFDLVKIADQAASGKLRVIPPDAERCMERGGWFLADCTENQMGLAVTKECFRRFGKEKGFEIALRYTYRAYALCEARHAGILDEFSEPPDSGRIDTDVAVFRAAARAPINRNGEFETEQYVALIRS